MVTGVDVIFGLLLAFAVMRGWQTGLLRAILVPFVFTLSFIIGCIVLDASQNIIKSILVVLFATIVIHMALVALLYCLRRSVPDQSKHFVFLPSRICGMIVNLSWQFLMYGALLMMLVILPSHSWGLGRLQEEITGSNTYALVYDRLLAPYPKINATILSLDMINDSLAVRKVQGSPDYKKFANNPIIRNIMADQQTLDQVDNRNFIQLLQNEKIQALINDEGLMSEFTRICSAVYEKKLEQAQTIKEQYKARKANSQKPAPPPKSSTIQKT